MKTLLNLLLSIPVAIFGGFILSKMWGWFIAPKFGLPNLSIVEAVGVSTTVNFVLIGLYLSHGWTQVKEKHDIDDDTLSIIKTVITGVLIYPLALLGAYIWSRFLP